MALILVFPPFAHPKVFSVHEFEHQDWLLVCRIHLRYYCICMLHQLYGFDKNVILNSALAYIVSFKLRMFWIKPLIYHGDDHSNTGDVSLPHINYIVCWLTIISFLETYRDKTFADIHVILPFLFL